MAFRTTAPLGLLVPALFLLLSSGGAEAQQNCFARLPTERVSLDLRAADVQTTLRLLAHQYRINLMVTDDVTGTATLSFFEVPVSEVFRAILESAALECTEREGVLRVSTRARLRKEDDERAKTEEARKKAEAETRKAVLQADIEQQKRARDEIELAQLQARGPIVEETIRLRYADAEEVAKALQGILGIPAGGLTPPAPPTPGLYAPPPPTTIESPPAFGPPPEAGPPGPPPTPEALAKGLTITAYKPTNSIFVRYYANDLERIKKLIREKLDIPLPQVNISGQMVIVNRTALEQIGIQWGGALVDQRQQGGTTRVGTGFTGPAQTTGTPATGFVPANPGFLPPSNIILPVDPLTALPTGGNIVNLPTSLLPTTANPAFGLLFGIVGTNFNFSIAIQALERQGRARQLAAPKIVTVENSKAIMSRGFEVPYISQSGFGGTQVQFKDALLKLEVTPAVIQEDSVTKIKMKVVFENNEPDFTRAVLGNPPIFKRRAEAIVLLREGERLVIGGVTIQNDLNTIRQVPILGRIPIFGWLFKSREITSDGDELIVIITPTVVQSTPAARR